MMDQRISMSVEDLAMALRSAQFQGYAGQQVYGVMVAPPPPELEGELPYHPITVGPITLMMVS